MSLELKAGLVEIEVHESIFLEEWAICIWLSLLSPSHISLRPFLLDVCVHTHTDMHLLQHMCRCQRTAWGTLFFPLCRFQGWSQVGTEVSGQAWRKSLLPTALSCQPRPHYFITTELLYPDLLIVFSCYLPSEILFSFYIFNDFGLMFLDKWLASLFVLSALHVISWVLRHGKQTPKCLRGKKT